MGKQVVLPLFSGALPRPVTVPRGPTYASSYLGWHHLLSAIHKEVSLSSPTSRATTTTLPNACGSDRLAAARRYAPVPSGLVANKL